MGKYHGTKEILELMKNPKQLRNVAFVGHIDHGKTTLSDSLLAEAGLLSESLAGEARALDYLEEEQRRGITMKSANVSLYYENLMDYDKPFVVNLVDTPGHLDFSGKVTRALRLVDGVIVIVDAVEEINSQSETVIKQALEEAAKPILFINKIDRLFRELKLSNDEIKEKLNRIVIKFNNLIARFAGEKIKEFWAVSPEKETVIFGSALHRWGFTLPQIVKSGWTFKDLAEKYANDDYENLHSIFPVWDAVLETIVNKLPNPVEAQSYRIKKIWHGDYESEIAKSMLECNPKGPLVMSMSNIKYDSHGLIATGRIFSGTLKKGEKVLLIDNNNEERILKVALYMGSRTDNATSIPAGNIAAVGGLKSIRSGETLVGVKNKKGMVSFESVNYVSDPVVTVAIEPEMLKDLNTLQTYLDQILIEDPNLKYSISDDTGEILLSGMGPLHLEVAGHDLERKGIKVTISKPMSVFRESISGPSKPITITSEDGTTEITIKINRNDNDTIKYIKSMKLSSFPTYKAIIKSLKENTKLLEEEANGYIFSDEFGNLVIYNTNNLLIEEYKGRKNARQQKKSKKKVKDTINKLSIAESTTNQLISAFKSIFLSGPLCREKIADLKITIEDMKIKTENSQIDEESLTDFTPLIRQAIFKVLNETETVLLEPIYQLIIQTPAEHLGKLTGLLSQHQAKIISVEQDEYIIEINALVSVREYISLSEEIRSTSSGRAFWQASYHSFEEVPANKMQTIIQDIKFRKGMFF